MIEIKLVNIFQRLVMNLTLKDYSMVGWFSVLEIKIGQLLGRIIEITKDWTHLNRKLQ